MGDDNGSARVGRQMNSCVWEERSKRASGAESLAGPWEKALHELSTRQTFSEEPQRAAGRCSAYPLSLSAGMGSGPFNLISDSHCRDGDPVGGSLHDARDWVHAANGQWVDVSTLMRSSPLARSAYSPKPAAAEQSTEEGWAVGRRICNHQPPRYHQLPPLYH